MLDISAGCMLECCCVIAFIQLFGLGDSIPPRQILCGFRHVPQSSYALPLIRGCLRLFSDKQKSFIYSVCYGNSKNTNKTNTKFVYFTNIKQRQYMQFGTCLYYVCCQMIIMIHVLSFYLHNIFIIQTWGENLARMDQTK